MDMLQCDKWDYEPLRNALLGELVSHNNIIYSFDGRNGDLFILDVIKDEMKFQPRIDLADRRSPDQLVIQISPAIAVHDGHFYTVFGTRLFQCAIDTSKKCQVLLDDAKFLELNMIRFHTRYIFLLLHAAVERCTNFGSCESHSIKDFGETWCRSMAISGEYLYVANCDTPQVLRYKVDSMQLERLEIAQGVIGSHEVFINTYKTCIYIATGNSNSWRCNLTNLKICEQLSISSRNFVVVYASVEMMPQYRGENIDYEKDNSRLELGVSAEGKLIDANGSLFDTSNANFYQFDPKNETNGINAAIFVMDNSGSIYASNYHDLHRYRHSSLMAGKAVSSAGIIQVSKGVIKYASSSSYQYRVPLRIASQFLDSLQSKGYSASVVDMVYESYCYLQCSDANH